MEYEIDLKIDCESREEIRQELIYRFLQEEPGTGTGKKATIYIYHVESYRNFQVTLTRPTFLNHGFDFQVRNPDVDYDNRTKTMPKHSDIYDILKQKKKENPLFYSEIVPRIRDCFRKSNPGFYEWQSLGYFSDHQNKRIPLELLILSLKWLFIEQDINYWNYSGRNKLYSELSERNLV